LDRGCLYGMRGHMAGGRVLMADWRSTLAGIGFRPDGALGAMRVRVEDVDVSVIEDGLGRLRFMLTQVGARSALQYEVAAPLQVTAQQVGQILVDALERAHPEVRGRSGTRHSAPAEHGLVRVGGALIDRDKAVGWARTYLTEHQIGRAVWAYPAYDTYRRGYDDPYRVDDADLLAPALLNVNRITLPAFYALQAQRDRLQDWLLEIPREADLTDADDRDLEPLRMLFGVLDDPGIPDVRGTILAKILHRKRPGFIPLYDEHIRWCYQDAERAPVPMRPGRPWGEFFVALAKAMRTDLQDQHDTWADIADLAPDPPITVLRALDIVGWRAGRDHVHGQRPEPETA
jgi:hypothetical protein